MQESTLELKLKNAVKRMGGIAIKIWAVSFTGLPDRLILLPGGICQFAEVKKPAFKHLITGKMIAAGTLSPRQKIVKGMLEKLGFKVWVINSIESLNQFIEQKWK